MELKRGVAPGTGGLRNEHLKVLAEKMSREQMYLVQNFAMRYVCGELPDWFYVVWLSVQSLALFKTKDKDAVRPIGIRNPLAKSIHRQVVQQSMPDIVKYLEPEQQEASRLTEGQAIVCWVAGVWVDTKFTLSYRECSSSLH